MKNISFLVDWYHSTAEGSFESWLLGFSELGSGFSPAAARSGTCCSECPLFEGGQTVHAACGDQGKGSQCNLGLNYVRDFCSLAFSDKPDNSFAPFPIIFSLLNWHIYFLDSLFIFLLPLASIFLAFSLYLGSQRHRTRISPEHNVCTIPNFTGTWPACVPRPYWLTI